ncbi:hypothetical protein [Halosegnis sp.]|uniref:DUF7475 family protein n=1 Tax=Halosegnis sp. TaxID=2864959 RepID=UPI0035D4A049
MATQTQSGGTLSLATDSLTPVHYFGVLLAVISGVLHLVLGVQFAPSPLGISFILAGVGFLVGSGAILVDYRRRLFYLLGIPFTLIQIGAWYAVNAPNFSTLGIGDKVVQVLFVLVLVTLYRRE